MKLITNRISTGKAKRFEDFIADFKSKKNIKTASVKTAEQEEADSSGQLDVEPLHQEGESTTMPKAGPSAKKDDDGEKSAAATKEHPAQVVEDVEEYNVGKYVKERWNGSLTSARKSEILGKLDTVGRAIKQARQRANCVDVPSVAIGQTLMDFITG